MPVFGIRQRLMWMFAGIILAGVFIAGMSFTALPGVAPLIRESAPVVSAQQGITLTSLEQQLIQLYDVINPSVVSIQIVGQNGFGQGSGFVYNRDGYIVTNYHVAGQALQISVIFSDGTSVPAELVGADPGTDLAVIRVEPSLTPALNPLPLGDSEALRVGQMVIAVGNPFGLQGSMTMGIVSALGRTLPSQEAAANGGIFNTPDVIQTDAAMNPGNSGGPLLNLAGQVVGINTAIRSSSRENSGIGFSVPSSLVARVVPALIQNGVYRHPWLGIAGRSLDNVTNNLMSLDRSQRGILVAAVSSGSPAMAAGLRGNNRQAVVQHQTVAIGGDIIISVDGQTVETFDDLLHYLATRTSVGQTISLGVLRDGARLDIPVQLAERP